MLTNCYQYILGADVGNMHQFGFKKSHATGLCTYVLKSTVDYYIKNGSHVFVDFSKAFDYVDYWLLFSKLLESSDDNRLWLCTRILACWYSYQLVYVRWGSTNQSTFVC